MKPPAVAASLARQRSALHQSGEVGRGSQWGGVKGAHRAELGEGRGRLECLRGPFWDHNYF